MAALWALCLFTLPPAWAQQEGGVLVVWEASVALPPDAALLERLGTAAQVEFTHVRDLSASISLLRWSTAAGPGETQVLDGLRDDPAVRAVQADHRQQLQFVPQDPLYANQWYLYEAVGIEAPSAWDLQRGSSSVVIATLDTGILDHVDFNYSRVLPGYDFISDVTKSNDGDGRDANPTDPGDAVAAGDCGPGEPAEDSSWHGLAVAGVMLATADNLVGVSGIDHGARLLPVRVFGKCGALFSDILDALRWAAGLPVVGVLPNSNPADVINLSFGGDGACGAVEQAVIDEVLAAGAVLVAAAGNDGGDAALVSPASCAGVITVTAVTRTGVLAAFSNIGEEVSIAAAAGTGGPGAPGVLTLWNDGLTVAANDSYAYFQGTSFAAAQVSGVVALMRAEKPTASPAQIRQALRASAKPFPDASCNTSICGAGLLDAHAAVLAAAELPASTGSVGGGGGGGCVSVKEGRLDPLWLAGGLWFLLRWRRGNDSGSTAV